MADTGTASTPVAPTDQPIQWQVPPEIHDLLTNQNALQAPADQIPNYAPPPPGSVFQHPEAGPIPPDRTPTAGQDAFRARIKALRNAPPQTDYAQPIPNASPPVATLAIRGSFEPGTGFSNDIAERSDVSPITKMRATTADHLAPTQVSQPQAPAPVPPMPRPRPDTPPSNPSDPLADLNGLFGAFSKAFTNKSKPATPPPPPAPPPLPKGPLPVPPKFYPDFI